MANNSNIEITVEIRNGVPTVGVKGAKGPACKQLTKELEEDLGEVVSSAVTPEYREQAQTQGQQRSVGR